MENPADPRELLALQAAKKARILLAIQALDKTEDADLLKPLLVANAWLEGFVAAATLYLPRQS